MKNASNPYISKSANDKTEVNNIISNEHIYHCQVPPLDSILIITTHHFVFKVKRENYVVQYNKHHHRKLLLSSFHLNGHTLGFHPQTQKVEAPCTA